MGSPIVIAHHVMWTLYGWWLFDMLPPASTWLGAPLIVIAGLIIAWRERRFTRPDERDIARAEGP